MILILSYLSYKDYLCLQCVSKKFYQILKNKRIRKKYILNSEISIKEQLLFYESNINVNKLKMLRNALRINLLSNALWRVKYMWWHSFLGKQ